LWIDPLRKTLPSFAFCLLLLVFIGEMEPLTWAPGGGSRYDYVITQPYVILRYFTTFFLPLGLSADTDWKPLASVADVRFVAGSLFVAALLVIAVMTARKERLRPISFGILPLRRPGDGGLMDDRPCACPVEGVCAGGSGIPAERGRGDCDPSRGVCVRHIRAQRGVEVR
jgi:hypothetical protein